MLVKENRSCSRRMNFSKLITSRRVWLLALFFFFFSNALIPDRYLGNNAEFLDRGKPGTSVQSFESLTSEVSAMLKLMFIENRGYKGLKVIVVQVTAFISISDIIF